MGAGMLTACSAEPAGKGRQCGDAISSKRLAPARAQGDGGFVRAHRGGQRGVALPGKTPFAALPSMRNLALTYEEESMGEVDGATLIARSLKQQGIDHPVSYTHLTLPTNREV